MKPVSQEEYTRMQAEDWEWAKALIQCQIDDKRPGVQHLTNRPVINIKADAAVQCRTLRRRHRVLH